VSKIKIFRSWHERKIWLFFLYHIIKEERGEKVAARARKGLVKLKTPPPPLNVSQGRGQIARARSKPAPLHREPSHPFGTNYLYRAGFVFCVGHFLIRTRNAQSVSARSGTEITKSLGACSEIRVADRELADRTFRARVLKNKHGRLKTQNTKHARSFIYILNGCEGSLCPSHFLGRKLKKKVSAPPPPLFEAAA